MDEQILLKHLKEKIPNQAEYPSIIETIDSLLSKPWQGHQLITPLPSIYLTVEQLLVDIIKSESSRDALREEIRTLTPNLLNKDDFGLIFAPKTNQEILLARLFLLKFLEGSKVLLGNQYENTYKWIEGVPVKASMPLPLGIKENFPLTHNEWLNITILISKEFFNQISHSLGKPTAKNMAEKTYHALYSAYLGLESFPVVIQMLPKIILDREKLGVLSAYQHQK